MSKTLGELAKRLRLLNTIRMTADETRVAFEAADRLEAIELAYQAWLALATVPLPIPSHRIEEHNASVDNAIAAVLTAIEGKEP